MTSNSLFLLHQINEARALYNLGNVYYAKRKHAGRSGNQDPGELSQDDLLSLQQASQFYE